MAEVKKYQDAPRYRVINDYENDFKKSWKQALREGLKEMGVELQRAVQRTPLEKAVETKPLNSFQSKQDVVVDEVIRGIRSGKSLNLSEIGNKAQLSESTVKEVICSRLSEIVNLNKQENVQVKRSS